ncbi:MAG: lyase family protein [Hyphomonadaceae bacterium]
MSRPGVERLATEIRHLQRTEVLEAEEFFEPGQKGSSAMPHKRNPVLTENLCGLARLVRSAVTPAMENVAPGTSATSATFQWNAVSVPTPPSISDFALHVWPAWSKNWWSIPPTWRAIWRCSAACIIRSV